MVWLSDLWFDMRMAWIEFRIDRQWRKHNDCWQDELLRLREKGL